MLHSGIHDGRPWLAMELVDGGTLRELIQARRLTARECVQMGLQIGEGLTYIHSQGVLHRDLKPDNVLLENGSVKITDFGLAGLLQVGREAHKMTGPMARLGTAGYMAPEQAVNLDRVGPAADLYALGVVLFESLTGQLPHAEELPGHLAAGVPRKLDDLIASLLARDSGARPASATAVVVRLRELQGDDGEPVQPAGAAAVQASASTGTPSAMGSHSSIFARLRADVLRCIKRAASPSGQGRRYAAAVSLALAVVLGASWHIWNIREVPAGESTSSADASPGQTAARTAGCTLASLAAQRLGGIQACLLECRRAGSEVLVTVQFKATPSYKHGFALALKAEHSDGIAHFWKFFPTPRGSISDAGGRAGKLLSSTGLGFARDTNDWRVVTAEEEAVATLSFEGLADLDLDRGLSVSVDLWTVQWCGKDTVTTAETLYFRVPAKP